MSAGKVWHRSRTILLQLAATLVYVAPELADLPRLAAWRAEIALGVAVLTIVLRLDTREPVRARTPPVSP